MGNEKDKKRLGAKISKCEKERGRQGLIIRDEGKMVIYQDGGRYLLCQVYMSKYKKDAKEIVDEMLEVEKRGDGRDQKREIRQLKSLFVFKIDVLAHPWNSFCLKLGTFLC